MKKFFNLIWIALATMILSCGCDKLERAIEKGYKNAFLDAGAKEQVRLSENDYENICLWFETYAEEKEDDCYNDTEWRWEYIQAVLYDNFDENEVGRVDETQWLGRPPLLPLAVDVYLDNTSSMKGYVKHSHVDDQVFVNVFHAVDDYLFRCDEKPVIKSYYTQRNKEKKTDEIVELAWEGDGGMKDQLDHNRIIGFTDSYKLNNFLDDIVTRMLTDEEHRHLSFFITDGIPSGPNEKVKPGGTWNIDHATELQKQIRDIARKAANNECGVSVYQFEGDFYGEGTDKDKACYYWYHDNSNRIILPSNKIKRPFYVIVIGDADMTVHFKEEVEKGLQRFKPIHQVHFVQTPEKIQILVSDGNKIVAEYDEDEYLFSNLDEDKLNTFISIPLATLPSFFSDEETLAKVINLKVDGKNLSAYKMEKGKVVFGPISIEKNARVNIDITIQNEAPNWAVDMNVTNDIKEGCDKGTFNFLVLIDGLREGYVGNNDVLFPYLESFSIKREN